MMLFSQPFERLFRAVNRIAEQLRQADPDQRRYLIEELDALRAMSSDVFELWLRFEDEVDALLERYSPADASSSDADLTQPVGAGASAPTGDAPISTPHAPHAAVPALSPQNLIPAASFAADLGSAWNTPVGFRLLRRGLGYFDLLMFPESIREFEQMVALAPDMVVARLYLALSYIATDAFENAETQLALVRATATDRILRAAVHDALAQLYMKQERIRDAQNELERVLAIQPEYGDVQVNLAICAYSLGDYAKARRAAAGAIQLAQDDALAWRLYAASAWAQGDLVEAHRGYRSVLRLMPANSGAVLEMAAILTQLNRVQDAESLLRELLDNGREPQSALKELAELALRTGDFGKAALLFKKCAALHHDADKFVDRLGWALYGAGRLEEARRAFERHLAVHGASVSNLTGLARIAASEGDTAAARELLARFTHHANPEWRAHGLAELGRLYQEMGASERAIRYLHSALSINRRQEDALLYLEMAQRAAGQETQTAECAQTAGVDRAARLFDTESIDPLQDSR